MLELKHNKFDSKALNYQQGRPGYPELAIRFLSEKMALNSAMTVADIGAGTGLLTRILQSSFANVVPIEPNDDMRSYLGANAINGTAEETKLPNKSVHAVFAAQAFHWFDIDRARTEFRRILRDSGGVALLWNDRDTRSYAGLSELEDLMSALRGNNPQALEADASAIQDFFQSPKLNYAEFENPTWLLKESFRAMVLSRSYAPRPGSAESLVLVGELDRLFASHSRAGQFLIPYKTRVYWGSLS